MISSTDLNPRPLCPIDARRLPAASTFELAPSPHRPSTSLVGQRAAGVRDPQLVVGDEERDAVARRRRVGHRVVGVLQQLVDEPPAVVARDLRLLADVLLEPRRHRPVGAEVLLDDALDDVLLLNHLVT